MSWRRRAPRRCSLDSGGRYGFRLKESGRLPRLKAGAALTQRMVSRFLTQGSIGAGMSYAINNLRKLAHAHPHLFPSSPAHPKLLDESVDSFLLEHTPPTLPPAWIKLTLQSYRNSIRYQQAVAARKPFLAPDGSAVRTPAESEVRHARDYVERYSVSGCIAATDDKIRSPVLARYCAEILEWEAEAVKFVSSRLARTKFKERALELRREHLRIREAIYRYDPCPWNASAVATSQYFCEISETYLHQHAGRFSDAKACIARAVEAARQTGTMDSTFFPNLFRDETDLASYDILLDAMEAFSLANYSGAAQALQRWVDLNSKRRGRGDASFDVNLVNLSICEELSELQEGRQPCWANVEELLNRSDLNIFRTARALWDRLEALVASTRAEVGDAGTIADHLQQVSEFYPFLSISAPLTGRDRGAGVEETIRLCRMVDLFDVATVADEWTLLVSESIRAALLMRVDYEARESPERFEKRLGAAGTREIERLSAARLLEATAILLHGNHPEEIIERWKAAWLETKHEISAGRRESAIAAAMRFHRAFRAVPHVVRVRQVRENDARARKRASYTLNLERCWRTGPPELLLETTYPLSEGTFAYLRPRWNRTLRPQDNLGAEDEPLFPSRVPEWMDVFAAWCREAGAVPRSRFLLWLNQIEVGNRAVALRLLSRTLIFTEEAIRTEWQRIFKELVPADTKTSRTILVSAGPIVKSGAHHIYLIRQALTTLPKSASSIDAKRNLISMESLRPGEHRDIVLFDDFLGTGESMSKNIKGVLDLCGGEARITVLALVAFDVAIEAVRKAIGAKDGRVIVGRVLTDADRAFSSQSRIWDSDADRDAAQVWAEGVGLQLGFRPEDALGWKGSQALVAFPYNTPNNTLPLFWANGRVKGRPWNPLFTRY